VIVEADFLQQLVKRIGFLILRFDIAFEPGETEELLTI
jgi:hypothetical protein